ncbi:hypothetical protein PN36_32135 [Candidatus Thiomargarita nelsonii]|uniref:Uncharacterized protein n=1 Tax=Candidatus Thiomargarita nelsonii TaxID=1003181 RepID=A0A4E0QJU4_9GAMM|nr:hypothetical protein PN36_32135 [Candidatus Thiomargarita nelsonii]
MTAEPPAHILTEYQQRGWTEEVNRDGMKNLMLSSQAVQDSLAKGYFHYTENVVQVEARHFIQYLAQNLDADGGTTVIYWACGEGDKIEVLGDVRAEAMPLS